MPPKRANSDQHEENDFTPLHDDYLESTLFDMNSHEMGPDLPLDRQLHHINSSMNRRSMDIGEPNRVLPLSEENSFFLPQTPLDFELQHAESSTSPSSVIPSPKRIRSMSSGSRIDGQDNNSGDAGRNVGTPNEKSSIAATRESPKDSGPGVGNHLEIKKMTDIKSRACDECRRRKTACYYLSIENTKCFRCQMENIECTFSTRTRANANSSGSTAQPRQAPISQRVASKQQLPSMSPVEDYSKLPGRSLLKRTLSLQHPRSSFAVGQHGLWDQRVLESIDLDKANQARVSNNLSLRKVGPDSWFVVRNEDGQGERIRDCDDIERLVFPHGRALVNAFFMYFQPEYPILHEKIFVEKYLRTYRELMPALLGAVYLLGMRWWNHSIELSTVARPDHIVPALYDLTLMSFFRSSGGSSLSLVQAGLLLLQCSSSDTRHLSICSIINAAAFRLALNRNCLHWKLPRWEINLRLRLSWATYSQSTWVSLFESIPPLIQDASWFLSALNADMFDSGSNEPSYNGALFIQLNKLSLIVHDMHNLLSSKLFMMYSSESSAQQAAANNANVNIMNPIMQAPGPNIYPIPNALTANLGADGSPRSTPEVQSPAATGLHAGAKVSAETVLEMIKPIQLRLHDWYSGLPPALINVEGDPPMGNFSLRIAHIAAEVTLHRFIIRSVCSKAQQISLEPDMLKLLRSSAKDRLEVAHDLLKLLRPQHLQQFWYFPAAYQLAVIGIFAALMYTTSEDHEEAEHYAGLLRSYIEKIQVYSDNDVMSVALRTLRSSIAGISGLAF